MGSRDRRKKCKRGACIAPGEAEPRSRLTAELAVGLPVLKGGSRVQHHDAVSAIAGRVN